MRTCRSSLNRSVRTLFVDSLVYFVTFFSASTGFGTVTFMHDNDSVHAARGSVPVEYIHIAAGVKNR